MQDEQSVNVLLWDIWDEIYSAQRTNALLEEKKRQFVRYIVILFVCDCDPAVPSNK